MYEDILWIFNGIQRLAGKKCDQSLTEICSCWSQRAYLSSIVSDRSLMLLLHPILDGKSIQFSDMLFRAPHWPHRVCTAVSSFDFWCPTDLCRFEFNSSALMPRSIDSIGTFRGVFVSGCIMLACSRYVVSSFHAQPSWFWAYSVSFASVALLDALRRFPLRFQQFPCRFQWCAERERHCGPLQWQCCHVSPDSVWSTPSPSNLILLQVPWEPSLVVVSQLSFASLCLRIKVWLLHTKSLDLWRWHNSQGCCWGRWALDLARRGLELTFLGCKTFRHTENGYHDNGLLVWNATLLGLSRSWHVQIMGH